ncbi:ABC transporter ATP-binding protein [Desulfotignum balticum]|uniref:ATP-binding cassette domain-containing protein n=1 Tax=Desulfotignum balticum TaxID=115781 RepID=A0A931G6I2_9BACT|nr:ABC transporter ATP-binding protein [Desulfotignum balticum]MBG0778381.1 ATP-binding cassette domain-containing protein [Desulfotignum balticum]
MISNDSNTAVELDRLYLSFDGQPVLKNLHLSIFPGDKVTLTGPSGSGKSTVLRCILGLVMPDSGTITILGEPVTRHNIWQKRRHIAYVAQEPDLGAGSVKEVIETPFSYRANAGLRDNLARLPEIMERFNLPQLLLDKQITRLSGGEKQRIALTIAILLDRPIVLLDEASSALDTKNKQAVADYFRQAQNTTLLSVAHDFEWLGFATRVVDMNEIQKT